jgi:hypothetical protein
VGKVGKVTKLTGGGHRVKRSLTSFSLLPLFPYLELFPVQSDRRSFLGRNHIGTRTTTSSTTSYSMASTTAPMTSTCTAMTSMCTTTTTIVFQIWTFITQMSFFSTIEAFSIINCNIRWLYGIGSTHHLKPTLLFTRS